MKVSKKLVDDIIATARGNCENTNMFMRVAEVITAQRALNDVTEDDVGELITDMARFTTYLAEPHDAIYKMIAILGYEVEGEWKPKKNEIYYTIYFATSYMYVVSSWQDDAVDNRLFELNLVFRTKEEAIAMTEKMLAVAKEK